jgi:hypothetical protein
LFKKFLNINFLLGAPPPPPPTQLLKKLLCSNTP